MCNVPIRADLLPEVGINPIHHFCLVTFIFKGPQYRQLMIFAKPNVTAPSCPLFSLSSCLSYVPEVMILRPYMPAINQLS